MENKMLQTRISLKYHLLLGLAGGCWISLFLIFVGPFDSADQPLVWRALVMPVYGLVFFLSYGLVYPLYRFLFPRMTKQLMALELLIHFLFFSINLIGCFLYYTTDIINGDYSFNQFFLEVYLPTLMILIPLIIIMKWVLLMYLKGKKPKKKVLSDEAEIKEWLPRIELLIEDKIYLDSSITLQKMAQTLETNSSVLSRLINQGYNNNFNDFINKYRVEEVIKKLEDGENKTLTISGIAENCGFNSRATFNRAFKKQLGVSPGEYIKYMQNKEL